MCHLLTGIPAHIVQLAYDEHTDRGQGVTDWEGDGGTERLADGGAVGHCRQRKTCRWATDKKACLKSPLRS